MNSLIRVYVTRYWWSWSFPNVWLSYFSHAIWYILISISYFFSLTFPKLSTSAFSWSVWRIFDHLFPFYFSVRFHCPQLLWKLGNFKIPCKFELQKKHCGTTPWSALLFVLRKVMGFNWNKLHITSQETAVITNPC